MSPVRRWTSQVDVDPYRYRRQGRNRTALYAVLGIWSVLISAVVLVDAAWWLMGAIALVTLPAVWELITNRPSGLDLTAKELTWFTGRRQGNLARGEIEKMRFDTRLDFSVRASAILTTGRKVRLPYECTPPHQIFEAALNAQGIRVERHHFSLIG